MWRVVAVLYVIAMLLLAAVCYRNAKDADRREDELTRRRHR